MPGEKDGWRVSGEDGRGRVLVWVMEAQRATGCRNLGKTVLESTEWSSLVSSR